MSLIDDKKRKRNRRILDVAQRLFEEHGFNETTMSLIAQTAELGVGTLYNYYGSKNEIMITIFRESIDCVTHVIKKKLYRSEDPVTMALEYMEPYIENLNRFNKKLLKETSLLMISEPGVLQKSLDLNTMIIKTNEVFFSMLAEQGRISGNSDVEAAALMLFSIMKTKAMSLIYTGEEVSSAMYDAESMLRILFYGITDEEKS